MKAILFLTTLVLCFAFQLTYSQDPMTDLFDGLNDGITNQQLENIFLIKATYRFVL